MKKGWRIYAVSIGQIQPACTRNIIDGQTRPFLSWQV